MVWSLFQKINWGGLLRRECHGSDLPVNVGIMILHLNDLFENENEVYFQQDGAPPHFRVNVRNFLDRTFNQNGLDEEEVLRSPATISRFNPSRLLPLGNFKELGIRHKTTNTRGTERSD